MNYILATDEAGYGTWAGDLFVSGVLAPEGWVPPKGVTDSKKLSRDQQSALFKAIKADPAIQFLLVYGSHLDIDNEGVFSLLKRMHQTVHEELGKKAQGEVLHIADGNLKLGPNIRSIPKADALYPACSAASILAKRSQVLQMDQYAKIYPGYGFEKHCGYGTPGHIQALSKLGPCEIHRKSYEPIKRFTEKPSLDDFKGFLPQ